MKCADYRKNSNLMLRTFLNNRTISRQLEPSSALCLNPLNATSVEINWCVTIRELSKYQVIFPCCQVRYWFHNWMFSVIETDSFRFGIKLSIEMIQHNPHVFIFILEDVVCCDSTFLPCMIDKRFNKFSINFCYHLQHWHSSQHGSFFGMQP